MKYELETIPIWDTYELDCECPLCHLKKKAEENYINFFLGNSVMVPEMRVKLNKTGFCTEHYTTLLESKKNRHGLGLVSHTHLKNRGEEFNGAHERCHRKAPRGGRSLKKMLRSYCDQLDKANNSCMICNRLETTLARYAYTIIILWKKNDQGFRDKFAASKGFCAVHLPLLIRMATEHLGNTDLLAWSSSCLDIQKKSFTRLDEQIFWFTQKFDFQNRDKPWGESKDALHRTIQRLTGKIQDTE